MLGQKKLVLFLEITQVKIFYHSPARIVECVFQKKNKKKNKKARIEKKPKETKEEKRISSENQFKKINLQSPG